MAKHFPLPAAIVMSAALLGLSGCGSAEISRAFGLTRDAPDEFTVTTRAPLSMPPDYTLPVPQPGASRPQEQSAVTAAESALVPQAALGVGAPAAGAGLSQGQQALVNAAGPAAPADIRQKVDADAALSDENPGFIDALMFWKSPTPPGTVLDPQKEAQRLRQNAALGQSVQQGDTPIIQRTKVQGFLARFF